VSLAAGDAAKDSSVEPWDSGLVGLLTRGMGRVGKKTSEAILAGRSRRAWRLVDPLGDSRADVVD